MYHVTITHVKKSLKMNLPTYEVIGSVNDTEVSSYFSQSYYYDDYDDELLYSDNHYLISKYYEAKRFLEKKLIEAFEKIDIHD